MLVVAKTPPIRVEVFGEGMNELVASGRYDSHQERKCRDVSGRSWPRNPICLPNI